MPFDVAWVSSYFPELSLVELIGAGGQKIVFKAQHPTDGWVVLKIIDQRQDPVETEREILAVSTINSPRVPSIHEHDTVTTPLGHSVWIREHYVSGTTVADVINGAPLTLDECLRMMRHLLEALKGAESANIVHRDVKPANIVRDLNGDFWLLDFGIARHLSLASITATASIFGKLTLGYAPPEQMRNNKPFIDVRSDLFALGITVVECITGEHPFWVPAPASNLEVVKRVETQAVVLDFGPSPKAKAFEQLISTCIQKRRDLRPRCVDDALAWLDSVEATV
ncbi:MAG: serine/threonine-protein kinase [Acidobacteriaceae bacterium]|nr:serine/threonine-protein kinase [Acidobacteriaceae bacterium]